jgi:hypothetical protein
MQPLVVMYIPRVGVDDSVQQILQPHPFCIALLICPSYTASPLSLMDSPEKAFQKQISAWSGHQAIERAISGTCRGGLDRTLQDSADRAYCAYLLCMTRETSRRRRQQHWNLGASHAPIACTHLWKLLRGPRQAEQATPLHVAASQSGLITSIFCRQGAHDRGGQILQCLPDS